MFGLGYQELLLLLMVLGVPAALLWMAIHYSKKSPPIEPGCGIGGWLILFAIGVCLTPFVIANVMYEALRTTDWSGMAPAQIGFGGALLGLFAAVLLAWAIWNVVLFFGRRRAFPKAWIGLNATLAAIAIVGAVINPTSAAELAPTLFWTVVWGVYLVRSRRSQATFVRVGRTGERPALADQAPADSHVSHAPRHARRYRGLLQRRAVRLTIFVLVLIAVPTLAGGALNHYSARQTVYGECPVEGALDPLKYPGLVRLEFLGGSPSGYSQVRCSYSALVPKGIADKAVGAQFPPDVVAVLDALDYRHIGVAGLVARDGPASTSMPALTDSFAVPLILGGLALGLYAALFLLVWGLVWVWRGGRRRPSADDSAGG